MDKSLQEKQFHVMLCKSDIDNAEYCILPGDPGRCEIIAKYLDNPKFICNNREFCSWKGQLLGKTVLVTSTGIGGPSTAIAVEELAQLGIKTFIRVGTCGGINLKVKSGDLIIASSSVRAEGTSREYAPIEFPACADFDVTLALKQSAEKNHYHYHIGVVQSKDSFYGQHSPEKSPVYYDLLNKWESWKRLGVLASEMESAALFVVAAALGVRAGACFHVLWNQEREKAGLEQSQSFDTSSAIKTAVDALQILMNTP